MRRTSAELPQLSMWMCVCVISCACRRQTFTHSLPVFRRLSLLLVSPPSVLMRVLSLGAVNASHSSTWLRCRHNVSRNREREQGNRESGSRVRKGERESARQSVISAAIPACMSRCASESSRRASASKESEREIRAANSARHQGDLFHSFPFQQTKAFNQLHSLSL